MGLDNAFLASLSIAGEDFGNWDAVAGGAYDQTEQKYTPFDGVERTYVAKKTTSNVTLSRDYRPDRDGPILARKDALQGSPCVAPVLDKDANGNYQQNRPPYSGRVKAITPPDTDSDGTSVAKISIEISTGIVAA